MKFLNYILWTHKHSVSSHRDTLYFMKFIARLVVSSWFLLQKEWRSRGRSEEASTFMTSCRELWSAKLWENSFESWRRPDNLEINVWFITLHQKRSLNINTIKIFKFTQILQHTMAFSAFISCSFNPHEFLSPHIGDFSFLLSHIIICKYRETVVPVNKIYVVFNGNVHELNKFVQNKLLIWGKTKTLFLLQF